MGRGWRSGPGPVMDSALAGGVAAGGACGIDGEGSGEGTWPVLTADWLDGRTLADGEMGTGGGGIEFLEARLGASLPLVAGRGRELMSGIVANVAFESADWGRDGFLVADGAGERGVVAAWPQAVVERGKMAKVTGVAGSSSMAGRSGRVMACDCLGKECGEGRCRSWFMEVGCAGKLPLFGGWGPGPGR